MDCAEIKGAEEAKRAAAQANAAAKHDADVTYNDVKSHAAAEIERAEEVHEDEFEAADAELDAVKKAAAAKVAAAEKANAARKRAADRMLAEVTAAAEAEMQVAYQVDVDTKLNAD